MACREEGEAVAGRAVAADAVVMAGYCGPDADAGLRASSHTPTDARTTPSQEAANHD